MSEPIKLTVLEDALWSRVQDGLVTALRARGAENLVSPLTKIVHELLDDALRALHLAVLRDTLEAQAGLMFGDDDEQLQALYQAELSEHGYWNIARTCEERGWQVVAGIPEELDGEALLTLDLPFRWNRGPGRMEELAGNLGVTFEHQQHSGETIRMLLSRHDSRPGGEISARLMDDGMLQAGLMAIFNRLGCGMIHFTAEGRISAVSGSMLSQVRLEENPAEIGRLAQAIPMTFFDDVVWGLAQSGQNGIFENYRIRLGLPEADQGDILFNVSGFRDPEGTVISFWQVVDEGGGGLRFAEGSMLQSQHISNITRNYVPQMVEQKAREAVQFGKSSLSNEQRKMAVLFCDIVGFTSYTETHAENESVIDTLNAILRRISVSVKRYSGWIDKFMGDCLMALFDDPAQALRAAMDMQMHADDINSLRSRAGHVMLQLRIGVHWGEVVIGNVGTPERLDWTAIGDVVNTASRIEKACTPGTILASRALCTTVESACPGEFHFGEISSVSLKGKKERLEVRQVFLER